MVEPNRYEPRGEGFSDLSGVKVCKAGCDQRRHGSALHANSYSPGWPNLQCGALAVAAQEVVPIQAGAADWGVEVPCSDVYLSGLEWGSAVL